MIRRTSILHWITVAVAGVAVAFSGLGSSLPLDDHEIFVARSAEEMMARGEWAVPYFNDEPRLRKPPLNYWLVIGADRIMGANGEVSELEARLPSAIGGTAMVVLTFALGLVLFNRRVGLVAALLLASCSGYISYTHSARPEMVYAALCTAGLLGFALSEESRRWPSAAAWLSWCVFGLAILAKGPQLPLVILVGWLVGAAASKRFRASVSAIRLWRGLALAVAISLWWFILIWITVPEAQEVWRGETINRYQGEGEPWWKLLDPYYLYQPFGLVVPWVALFPLALLIPFDKVLKHDRAAIRLWWLLVTGMLLLSLSAGRRWYYMLPLMAPLCVLMSAVGLVVLKQLWSRRSQAICVVLLVGHVLAIAGVVLWLLGTRHDGAGAALVLGAVVVTAIVAVGLLVTPASRRQFGYFGAMLVTCGFSIVAFFTAELTGAFWNPARFERAEFARLVGEHVASDEIIGWYDDWPQEQLVLHRPIKRFWSASAIRKALPRHGRMWLLVDTQQEVLHLGTVETEVVIRHDYDGDEDRLQLWHIRSDAAARGAPRPMPAPTR